jgi:hypothetical protein
MTVHGMRLGFVIAALVACGCAPSDSHAILRVQVTDKNGDVTRSANGTYDFGIVSNGQKGVVDLVVENVGTQTAHLTTFEKVSGHPVSSGTSLIELDPIFFIDFTDTDLAPNSTVRFPVHFNPPIESDVKLKKYQSTIKLRADNKPNNAQSVEITFVGQGSASECELPSSINFGEVEIGDTFFQRIPFLNTQATPTQAFAGEIQSPSSDVFSFTAHSPSGHFTIPSGVNASVTLQFVPRDSREYAGQVSMRRTSRCPAQNVRLFGKGVTSVLARDPQRLDFGFAKPGRVKTKEVVFKNRAFKSVTLIPSLSSALGDRSVFSLSSAQVLVPAAKVLNGVLVEGTATLAITCQPREPRTYAEPVSVETNLVSRPAFSIPLTCAGGGPEIEVTSAPQLNMGRIAYFAGSMPTSFARQNLVIKNVGSVANPKDARANLRLGQRNGNGEYTKPYWQIAAANATSSLDEICVGVFDVNTQTCAMPQLSTDGIEAGNTLDIPIRIVPTGLGNKEFTLTLFSNDEDRPAVTIPISAQAVTLPPCNISFTGFSGNFGLIPPGQTKEATLTIQNRGTQGSDICLIRDLHLEPEIRTPNTGNAVFSLPRGEISEKELLPGERMQVVIRAQTSVPLSVSAQLLLQISNPSAPQNAIPLLANVVPNCLFISPSAFDFGTVKKDCGSINKTFTAHNGCAAPVVVNALTLDSQGEFTVPVAPSVGSIAPGSSISFEVKYAPVNLGSDRSHVRINVTQAALITDYTVALSGQGDIDGTNTDVFMHTEKAQADILFVIDNSCSMFSKQEALASNFAAFIERLKSKPIDFHVGVTTAEVSSSIGRLRTVPFTNEKFVSNTTPMLEAKFAGLVDVGTNGNPESCLESASMALRDPLRATSHSEFLRSGASLDVVCITDAYEDAQLPASSYFQTLSNAKQPSRADHSRYHVFGPTEPNMPGATCLNSDPTIGATALEVIDSTNGTLGDICSFDLASFVDTIADHAFNFRSRFFLKNIPDFTNGRSVEVKLDGRVLSPNDLIRQRAVWRFDAAQNAVIFDLFYVPKVGSTVSVTYQVACH